MLLVEILSLGPFAEVDFANIVFARFSRQLVSSLGNLLVHPPPQSGRTGNVHHRCRNPQQGQTPGQIANRVGSAMSAIPPINDVHLLHQLIMRQIGISLRNPFIV